MSLLRTDKNGNLCEIGGLGDVSTPSYVEDNHLIYGHYKDQKMLDKIQGEEAKRQRRERRRRRQLEEDYAQQMGEIRKRSLIAERRANKEALKRNNQYAESYTQASRLPIVTGNPETMTLNPFAGFSEGDVYIDDMRNISPNSKVGRSDYFGRGTLAGRHNRSTGMGNIFEDAFNIVAAPILAPTKIIVRTITSGGDIKEAAKSTLTDYQRTLLSTRTDLKPITDPALATAGDIWESKIGQASRRIIFNKYTDPGYLIQVERRISEQVPIYGPIYKKSYGFVDLYTGQFLSRVENAASVPGRLGRGEPVTKAELINAAIIAMQAAAIIASGGSAAVIISLAASQMKQGPIGATKEGRTLLTLAEIAGYAYAGASAAGSAAAGSGAGAGASAGASAAGTAVAERTTAEIVTRAVAQKAQQMAAEEVAKKVAKETNTGVLGQIAVQGALGPGSFQDATIAAGKQAAVQEVAKQVGPEGMLIASAVVSASMRTESLGATIETAPKVFAEQLVKELEERVKIEAMHRAEQEIRKELGEPAASIAIAAMKGEKLEDIAKKQLTAQEQKIITEQLKQNDKLISQLNLQKQAELAKVALASPEERAKLINNATALDTQILAKQTEKNLALNQLGFVPENKQAALTDNAKTLQVPIDKQPNYGATPESRAKMVEKVKAEETAKLEAYQLKNYEASIEVSNYIGQLKMLTEEATNLRNAGKLAEAIAIELQMAALNKLIERWQADAITYAQMVEVQELQGAARIAAAEEGRYVAVDFNHPLVRYGLA